jgi:hypothetical protein
MYYLNKIIMKKLVGLILSTVLFVSQLIAQKDDKLTLLCPLKNPQGKEPKEAFMWNPPDKKVTMISNLDSLVYSSLQGKVSNVSVTDDNRYEVVIYYKEYYIWYYGITKPAVRIGQDVKAGEKIGSYAPGSELEFRLFKDEDAIDPREMLECRITKAG